MFSMTVCRNQWFGHINAALLSGLVVTLTLIPDAMGSRQRPISRS